MQQRFPVMKVEMEGGEEGKNTTEEEQKDEWWVPISYTSRSEKMFEDAQPKLWFNKETTIPDPAKPEDWLLVNLQMAGDFFSVLPGLFLCYGFKL